MRIAIVQTNPVPGDFDGNCRQIIDGIRSAGEADLIVAPELSIPGYLCRDAMLTEGFVDANLAALGKLLDESKCFPSVTIFVGYAERNATGCGKPLFNSAAVVRNGMRIANYRKHLLPFYDVFDEGRYFEPGRDLCVVDMCGAKFGVVICEDIWMDKMVSEYLYDDNPVEAYRRLGVCNLISLNSSPYVFGKPHRRQQMIRDVAKLGKPSRSASQAVERWIDAHQPEHAGKIVNHIVTNGHYLRTLPHGAPVFDLEGLSVCVADCMPQSNQVGNGLQPIFWPDGSLTYSLEWCGAVLL